MKLSEILAPLGQYSNDDCIISGLQNDSRLIQQGDLFIAYPGAVSDGRLFIEKALQKGASAVVYEPQNWPKVAHLPAGIPCVAISNLAALLPELAQHFYANPGQHLQVTGVTGTNGKTTIAYQLAQAHTILGQGAAYVGTIGQGEVNALQPLDNTTPDALCLVKLFKQYKDKHLRQVCMEVSSHALSQNRVDVIAFQQAIFTNLTLDHLDYHHTMQNYAETKARLFARPELKYAILNQDDTYQQIMSTVLQPLVKKLTYGFHPSADVRALTWQLNMQGTRIEVQSPWGLHQLHIQALGQFNIYNSLAIFASLLASGYPADQVVKVMAQLKAAPGRMEIVANSPFIIVDYAHTPDALDNVLSTLNQLKKGNLWVVFGCGGDRDTSKRPIMGAAASRYADHVVITSDNPRSEDPNQIVEQIAAGVASNNSVIKLINREEAITYAIKNANKNDIILIAGKGHEAYQQIGAVKHPFSDQEVVKKLVVG